MGALELVKVGLMLAILLGLPVAAVTVARAVCRRIDANTERIIGHIKAAGLASAALEDEFGPRPPAVQAGVQAGRHRELHLVGGHRTAAQRVMAVMQRLAAG